VFTLRLFGGFALEGLDGTPGPRITHRRAEALLALLALAGSRGCTRHRVLGLLWPDADEAHARHTLRDALLLVRQALGADAVLAEGDALRLNPAVLTTDVIEFTRSIGSAPLADAVRVYRGPLLEGFFLDGAAEFEQWLLGERTRLAREYAEAVERLASDAETRGAPSEAASWWARAVEHDPDNTRLVIRRMHALVASGDRANALAEAESHRRRLVQELEVEPDPELEEAVARIRRGNAVPVSARTSPASDRPVAVRAAAADLRVSPAPVSPASRQAQPPSRKPRRSVAIAFGGLAFVAVAVAAAAMLRARPLDITAIDLIQVTNAPGVEFTPAISPDGNGVAYLAGPISAPRLFLRSAVNAATGAAVRLGDTARGSEWFPSWTPGGQSVRYWSCPPIGPAPWTSGCEWMEMGSLGGAVRTVVLPEPRHPRLDAYASWSPDGSRVLFVAEDTTWAVTTPGGPTTRLPVQAGARSIAWSPDGRRIAYVTGNPYWSTQGAWLGGSTIWVAGVTGDPPLQITTDDYLNASPVWLDARHLLFVSDRDGQRAVYCREIGPRRVRGEPRIVARLTDPHTMSYSAATRRLAYAKFTPRGNIWMYPLGRGTPLSVRDGRQVTAGNQVIQSMDLSPDGHWIAYDMELGGHPQLYTMPASGGQATLRTSGPEGGTGPRWSPDGREMVFSRSDRIMVMSVAGGAPTPVASDSLGGWYPSWSPDGRHIAFQSARSGQVMIWLASRDSAGGPWHEPVQLSDSSCFVPDWAPDGTRLACRGGSGGLRFVAARTGHTVTGDQLTANHLRPLGTPHYARDGKTIYYAATDQADRRGIWALPVAGGRARLVVAFDDPALAWLGGLLVGPDRLYLTVGEHQSDIWVATLRW